MTRSFLRTLKLKVRGELLLALGIWVIYRIARGWLALRGGRALPIPA